MAFGAEHFIHIGIPKRATRAVLIEGAAALARAQTPGDNAGT